MYDKGRWDGASEVVSNRKICGATASPDGRTLDSRGSRARALRRSDIVVIGRMYRVLCARRLLINVTVKGDQPISRGSDANTYDSNVITIVLYDAIHLYTL